MYDFILYFYEGCRFWWVLSGEVNILKLGEVEYMELLEIYEEELKRNYFFCDCLNWDSVNIEKMGVIFKVWCLVLNIDVRCVLVVIRDRGESGRKW